MSLFTAEVVIEAVSIAVSNTFPAKPVSDGSRYTLSPLTVPIAFLAAKVTTAPVVEAVISTLVSPPSVIEPLSEVIETAAPVVLVVVNPPRAISSSAESVIVPVPELMVAPLAMVMAPPVPVGVLSSSAVTVMFPLVEARAPVAAKMTSSEADREVTPLDVTVPLTLMELSVSAVKVPPIFDVANPNAVVVLLITALPVVPDEFKDTSPVEAKVPRVIALSATSVVTVVVPDTVNAALSVITSPLINTKFPFAVPCTPNAVVPLSIVIFPEVPCEEIVTAPVNAFVVLLKVIA